VEEKTNFEETGAQPDLEEQTYIVGRLLKPEARKILNIFRKKIFLPTSMIDIN
jgi:thiamine-monophosphate kinase